jgi:hypothetical protein
MSVVDLSAIPRTVTVTQMAGAVAPSFQPFTGSAGFFAADNIAAYFTPFLATGTLVKFHATAGASYDIFSYSTLQSEAVLFDSSGALVSYGSYGTGATPAALASSVYGFRPAVSGDYYVAPNSSSTTARPATASSSRCSTRTCCTGCRTRAARRST